MIRLLGQLLLACLLVIVVPACAQTAGEPTPDQVKSLLQLLSDPVVKTWIAREMTPSAAEPTAPGRALDAVEVQPATFLKAGLTALKARLATLAAAVPHLPQELATAESRLFADLEATGWLRVLLLLTAFLGLGYGCERLFWRVTGEIPPRRSWPRRWIGRVYGHRQRSPVWATAWPWS